LSSWTSLATTTRSRLFESAIRKPWPAMGWQVVEVDISAFLDAARLLYEGPWVAERSAVVARAARRANPQALLPVTRTIIEGRLRNARPSTPSARSIVSPSCSAVSGDHLGSRWMPC